jgi:hypothetical protein
VIDFSNTWVVDHTVLNKLNAISRDWNDRDLVLTGLDEHMATSPHSLAARRKLRRAGAAA